VVPALTFVARHLLFVVFAMFAGTVLKNFAMFLSIPLGIYWWLTEGPGAVFDAFRRWLRSRRPRITQSEVGPPSEG